MVPDLAEVGIRLPITRVTPESTTLVRLERRLVLTVGKCLPYRMQSLCDDCGSTLTRQWFSFPAGAILFLLQFYLEHQLLRKSVATVTGESLAHKDPRFVLGRHVWSDYQMATSPWFISVFISITKIRARKATAIGHRQNRGPFVS